MFRTTTQYAPGNSRTGAPDTDADRFDTAVGVKENVASVPVTKLAVALPAVGSRYTRASADLALAVSPEKRAICWRYSGDLTSTNTRNAPPLPADTAARETLMDHASAAEKPTGRP